MKIQVEHRKDQGKDYVSYQGPLNEYSELHLTKLTKILGGDIVLNLRGVTSVNSVGVMSWVKFIKNLRSVQSIIIEECAPSMTAHMGMVPSMRGGLKVESVMTTYHCSKCDRSEDHLIKRIDLKNGAPFSLPQKSCVSCGQTMNSEEPSEDLAWLVA